MSDDPLDPGKQIARLSPFHRETYRAWRTITLRWSDNDAYGHVNNTVYYQWFDSAVNGWLVEQGLLDISAGDPIAFVAETRCTFLSPVSFPGEVDIGLRVVSLGRSSVRFAIGVFAQGTDTAVAEGEFVHVAVSRARRRPVPLPAAWRAALERLRSVD